MTVAENLGLRAYQESIPAVLRSQLERGIRGFSRLT
jgi:hypothetical protein